MSSILVEAFSYALLAHEGHCRKGSKIPYIVHPMDVVSVLLKNNAPNNVVIAGFLHDTIEDAGKKKEEVENLFGIEVADLVDGASEPEHLRKKDSKASWRTRKLHTITRIADTGYELKILSLADKLSNLRDIKTDVVQEGDTFWSKLNAPKEEQGWYYRSMLESFSTSSQIRETRAYNQFKALVSQVFPLT